MAHLSVGLATPASSAVIEFSASLAYDDPADKPLPGLTVGYGYGFSLGLMIKKNIGLSLGVNSTLHELNAGTRPGFGSVVHVDSRRTAIYFQGNYQFLTVGSTELEANFGTTYNSINGGDSAGSYIELNLDPEELGYSGWGWIAGIGLKHPIESGYFIIFNARYNYLKYSSHQFMRQVFTGPAHEQKGSSWLVNLGVLYRIDLSKLI